MDSLSLPFGEVRSSSKPAEGAIAWGSKPRRLSGTEVTSRHRTSAAAAAGSCAFGVPCSRGGEDRFRLWQMLSERAKLLEEGPCMYSLGEKLSRDQRAPTRLGGGTAPLEAFLRLGSPEAGIPEIPPFTDGENETQREGKITIFSRYNAGRPVRAEFQINK